MKITNRKAYHEYQILQRLEAGIALTGAEVKSVREGRGSLAGSFVKLIGGEAFLMNALIPRYEYAPAGNYDERRRRKLLLHKDQLIAVSTKLDSGNFTLVPLSLYIKDQRIKLEVAIGRGKKQYEKREAIKKRDLARDTETQLRGKR